jgi:hypothetical protein
MSSSYNLNTLDVPIMRNQRNGKVVNITSVGGRIAFPFDSIYHGTRFALEGLSECEFVIIPRLEDVVVMNQKRTSNSTSIGAYAISRYRFQKQSDS